MATRIRFACVLLCAWLAFSAPVSAVAPQTLGYQGHLADSGGAPITAILSITFRLYDVQSGGAALWSEVQPTVPIDGGNLAVELGKVTPLPASIWGRQLYLGIQVAGDSEMGPRPPLTAAPYALRAAGTTRNAIVVSAEGTPAENGATLIAAVATAAAAGSGSQVMSVEMDAGTFDLGSARLDVPPWIMLAGKSQGASVITSTNATGTVLFQGHNIGKHFTAINSGVPVDDLHSTFGIGAATPAVDGTIVSYVTLDDVAGQSIGPGAIGARWGIYMCAIGAIRNSLGLAQNGDFGIGLRADCQQASPDDSLIIDGLTLLASDSVGGVRGAYLSGGGLWRNIHSVVGQTQLTGNSGTYGLRIFPNALGSNALLADSSIAIWGTAPAGTTTIASIEGLRIDGANIDVKNVTIDVTAVKAANVAGLRMLADDTTQRQVRISDADIHVSGVQDAAQGFGMVAAVRAQGAVPQLLRTNMKVECKPGGYNLCGGIIQGLNPNTSTIQAGTLVLDQVRVETGHEAPADSSAQSVAFQGMTPARIDHSTLRVLRSAADELNSAVNTTGAGAAYRVRDSVLDVQSVNAVPATSNCVLANGGGGTVELYGGVVDGITCATPGPSLVCAGVIKRGSGFLAASCP